MGELGGKKDDLTDDTVLKSARTRCYKARDDYYECLDSRGIELAANDPVPEVCAKQRKDFEASCKASWVKHFDATRDRELGVLRTLKSNINASEKTSVGTLAGKDQRD